MRHEREFAIEQIGKPLIRLADTRHHHAIGATGFHHVAQHRELRPTGRHCGDEEIHAVLDKPLAEAGEEFAEIGVDEVGATHRHDEADEAGAPGDQLPGRHVGHIAVLLGCLGDPLARLERNGSITGKGTRNRAHRNVESGRQFAECQTCHFRSSQSLVKVLNVFSPIANVLNSDLRDVRQIRVFRTGRTAER